jgi:Uma2 family endonuclease
MQLSLWAERDGTGKAFDSGVSFILPDKSRLGPDGSWVSLAKLERLSVSDRRKYLRVVPEFVIELKSPSDRMPDLKLKMQDWKSNGVALGWLIDPDAQSVLIYRSDKDDAQRISGAEKLSGETPVAGFTFHLRPVWQGLRF